MHANPDPLTIFNLIKNRPNQPYSGGIILRDSVGVPRYELPAVVKDVLSRPLSYYEETVGDAPMVENMAPLTNVAFILDGSSSMTTGKQATIDGFNSQANAVREGAKTAGETRFTEVFFANEVQVRRVAASLDQLEPLSDANYHPEGGTALYDAIGSTIASLLQTPGINCRNTATLVTIFTDGEENSSRLYSVHTVRELISRLEATGRWTFALVGPSRSVGTLAQMLAVKPGNVAGFAPESVASRRAVFDKMVGASATYMSARSLGETSAHSLYAGK